MKRGVARRPGGTVERIDLARRTLLSRRADLLRRRASLLRDEETLAEEIEPGWEDVAAQVTAVEALDHLSDIELQQLERIAGALQRIEAGTFGRCTSCGEAIDEARLRVVPEAPTCIQCSA